jgi:two-component system response regulator HydG
MSKLTLKPSLEDEHDIIVKALIQTKYNKGKAAKLLGISRKTLYNKINRYHVKEVLKQN